MVRSNCIMYSANCQARQNLIAMYPPNAFPRYAVCCYEVWCGTQVETERWSSTRLDVGDRMAQVYHKTVCDLNAVSD